MSTGRISQSPQGSSGARTFVAGASVLMALTAAAAGGSGHQRSNVATLHVSMNVLPSCTVSATPLQFGDYDPIGAHATQPLDGEAIVTTVCTPNTRLQLEMNRGLNATGDMRRMSSGSEFLRYEVFQDAGRVQVWGSGPQALRFQTPANSTAPVPRSAYGRIEPGQNIGDGDYSDTIEIILHF